LSLPLLIHPLDGEANWFDGHRLADEYSGIDPAEPPSLFPGLTNSIGETFEQATTMSKLIVSGTLDKYPNLQIVIAHGGGAFPFIAGRVDYRNRIKLQRPFLEYLRRFYYDSLTYYPISLRYLINLVGSDRVVLGTDDAFGAGSQTIENPDAVIDQLNLPDQDRDLILRGNLKRIFRL
jgi:aminocarboxymuconate-semialdehyde decarboxylase